METEKIIRLSVRNLVEFILKEGDIDNRISGTLDKDAMLMGGRLHRKIQRMMGSNYQAEVSLKLQLPCDGFQLKLEGRADGILLESEKTIIDEIKGVVRSLDRVERPVPVHLAQPAWDDFFKNVGSRSPAPSARASPGDKPLSD